MFRKSIALILGVSLFSLTPSAHAELEVSLTVSGEIGEIQALLSYIEQRNRAGADEGNNPLKISVHSIAGGDSLPANMPHPVTLETPQLSAEKLTPGQPALVTVAVRDDRDEVDTLAIEVVGTNLKTDLYDDGTHGDEDPGDSVWSVTLTPMEATPAGEYELIITGYDPKGRPLTSAREDGAESPVQVRRNVSIER